MSDETPACNACERIRQQMLRRRIELQHQRDTLEFQIAAINARLEEVEDLLETVNEPPAPKRGRPRGGKPIVVATEAPLIDTPLLDQTA